jgi:hypothetical protein
MKDHLNLRSAALVAALAAIGATAWAANEYVEQKDAALAQAEPQVPAEPIVPSESLAPNESVVAPSVPAPVVEQSVSQPPITVEAPRLTLDQRIQADVMDRLANAPNISGKIGVESLDANVTLTGYTATAGQAYRAGRIAGSVDGVKYVQNEVRGRVGGSFN